MARGGTFGVGFVFEGALFAGVLFAIIEVAHGILFLVFFWKKGNSLTIIGRSRIHAHEGAERKKK